MRPVFRLPSETSLTAATETDLRLFVAHQKYNTRSRRLAEKELQRRMTAPPPSLSAMSDSPVLKTATPPHRPRGSLADIAWLGVMLGAGSLALQIFSWWGAA